MDLIAAVLGLQIATDLFNKVWREGVGIVLQLQVDRFVPSLDGLSRRDLAILQHAVDHQVATLDGSIGVIDRGVKLRGFWQSRQQRRLLNGELLCWLAKVIFGCRLETVHSVPKKNLVGVESEYLFLGKAPLNLNRQQSFLDLAMKRSIGRKKKVSRKLHGESRGALHFATRLNIAICSPGDPPHIDAPVTVEILVLNRNQGIAQHLRIVVIRRDHSPLQCERTYGAALPVVKLGNGVGTEMFQLLDLGKIRGIDQQQSGGGADKRSHQHQQPKQDAAHQFPSRDLNRWKVLIDDLHGNRPQNSMAAFSF